MDKPLYRQVMESEAYGEQLRRLTERLANHPGNAPGADKSLALAIQRRMQRFDLLARGYAAEAGPSVVGTDGESVQVQDLDALVTLCAAFDGLGLRYVLIGGAALNLYAIERGVVISTLDSDLLLAPEADSLGKALAVLRAQGYELSAGGEPLPCGEHLPGGEQGEDAVVLAGVLQARATVRARRGQELIDVLTQAIAMDFEDCWARHRPLSLQGRIVRVAPLDAIVASKRAANRLKDLTALEMWREQLNEPAPGWPPPPSGPG
ncbi:MAG: hypothetical protein ACT4PU_04335 [Planctomycetota bacterium]